MTGADADHMLTNQTEHKLVINNVRSDNRLEKLVDAEKTFTISDFTAPTVKSVEVQGLRSIKVTFSEDVVGAATAANYKIDGKSLGSFAAGTLTYNQEANAVTIPFAADLAEGSHELTISYDNGITDYVGLKQVEVVEDINVVIDTTIPAIQSAEVVKDPAGLTGKYVKVTFSKPLAYDGVVDNGSRYSAFTGSAAILIDGVHQDATIKSGVLYLKDTAAGTNYSDGGTHLLRINQDGLDTTNTTGDDKYIVDTSGIKLPDNSTYSYNVTLDTEAPTVTDVTVDNSKNLLVTFSEDVDSSSASSKANYTLKDSDGDVVAISSITWNPDSDGQDLVKLTLSADLKAGTYTLTMKDVKDQASDPNKLEAVTKTLVVDDIVKPSLTSATYDGTDNRTIYVAFSEAIDSDALLNKANYNINGKSLPSLATISSQQDGQVAKIVLPSNHSFGTLTGLNLTVANMVDLDGNKMSGLYQNATLAQVSGFAVKAYTTGETARVKDARTIELRFTKQLAELDADSFTVTAGATAIPVLATSTYSNKTEGYSVVTLKLGKDVVSAEGKTDLLANLQVVINDSGETKALDGADFGSATQTIALGVNGLIDYIDPELDTIAQNASVASEIDLTFTEAVTAHTGSDYDLSVYDVTDDKDLVLNTDYTVAYNAGGIQISIVKADVVDHVMNVSLNNGRYVVDAQGNEAVTFTDTTVRNSADDADALISETGAPSALVSPTMAATGFTGTGAEAGATIKVVASGGVATDDAVATATVEADGSLTVTGLTTATSYEVFVIDAAGNASAGLTVTTI